MPKSRSCGSRCEGAAANCRGTLGMNSVLRQGWRLSVVLILSLFILSSSITGTAQFRSLYIPVLQSISSAESRLMLVNSGVESARVTLTARTFAGGLLEGDGIINPVTMTLSPSSSRTLRAKEIFGASSTLGWVQIQTVSSGVSGTFSLSDTAQTSMDGADL